jgi:hypothetical protein
LIRYGANAHELTDTLHAMTKVRWLQYSFRRKDRLAGLAAVMLVVAVLTVAMALSILLARRTAAQSSRVALEGQIASLRGTHTIESGHPTQQLDFTARLPSSTSSQSVLEIAQSAVQKTSMTITAIQVHERPSATDRLGRTELSLSIHGSYGSLKRWLSEVTARLPAMTVTRFQLQRIENAPEVEARLTLSAWSRPLAATAVRHP